MAAEPSVVVVGSLHYDIMIDASHQPRTGETLAGERWYPKFGGKGGNQAVAVSQSGCPCLMVSAVGDDEFGQYLLSQLNQSQVNVDFIQTIPDCGSGMSVAITDKSGDYAAVIVSGANLQIDAQILKQDTIWRHASLLLLQNEVTEVLNIAAATEARKNGLQVCCNAAPARTLSKEFISLIDILMVNEVEAQAMCGVLIDSLEAAADAAKKLALTYETVLVTAGARGLAAASADGNSFSLEAIPVDVVSTHGAGDVFAGAFCAAWVRGGDLEAAARIANKAAGKHVSSAGSVC